MPQIEKNCGRCLSVLHSKPAEVQYTIMRDEFNYLYFYLNHNVWFDKFFQKSSDGIAIDIVNRKNYSCSKKTPAYHWSGKGFLLPPVYLKDLRKNSFVTSGNELIVRIGQVPDHMTDEEIEYNILFISNKYVCKMTNMIDLPSYKWELLDMGMYLDTISYSGNLLGGDSTTTYQVHSMRLKFIVPFEKNKYEFSPEDVKPIYDSLNFSDYFISRIEIRAFSSVEGSEEKNKILQNKRCESLVSAIQSYQKESIVTKIETSENWVEFLNDITGTPYQYLSTLTKQEIKKKLEDKHLSNSLESYFSTHRKGVLIFDLEKKNSLRNSNDQELKRLFNLSISERNIQRAKEIQEAILEKVKDHSVPESFLGQLEIPKQSEFGALLNNHEAFSALMNQKDVYESILAFEDLKDIFPDDGKIRYNIVALKFRAWLDGRLDIVTPVEMKKEIEGLKKYKIAPQLINRMLINYNIIVSEQAMMERDYPKKDNALKYIYNNYKKAVNTPEDILSLAQYFVAYAKFDWGVSVIEPYVKAIDGDEDLIFYYLTLTLLKPKITSKPDYRKVMLNAININKSRFCRMFDTYGTGGVSFQLLDDAFLKKGYCENCN